MAQDFLPAREADLAQWTANFHALTTATPLAYGLTAPQALQFATLDDIWQAALSLALDPPTRTAPTVAAKDVAMTNIKGYARLLAAAVRGFPSITPEQLSALGLTVPSGSRTPVPPPVTYPIVSVLSTAGNAITLAMADQNTPNARRRPRGVVGAQVYVAFGASPPTGIDQMTFLGLQTRFPANWLMGAANQGKLAWFIARWSNFKGQTGPISSPVGSIVA